MSINNTRKKNTGNTVKNTVNGTTELLKDIQGIKEGTTEQKVTNLNVLTENKDESSKVISEENIENNQTEPEVDNESAMETYETVKSELELAKELIAEDNEQVRRTFTIEALTHTQLNELKVYVLPAVTGQKKWGYNDIVNIAIKEYYERQKAALQVKLQNKK